MSAFGFLVYLPIFELAGGSFWLRSLRRSWATVPVDKQPDDDDVDERTLGATVIMGQLSAVITGSSIILAGIGAFVALKSDELHFPQSWHLFWAVVWAVAALVTAIYTTAVLPPRALRRNFVRDRDVAFLCSMALFFCLISSVRFLFAVGGMLI